MRPDLDYASASSRLQRFIQAASLHPGYAPHPIVMRSGHPPPDLI